MKLKLLSISLLSLSLLVSSGCDTYKIIPSESESPQSGKSESTSTNTSDNEPTTETSSEEPTTTSDNDSTSSSETSNNDELDLSDLDIESPIYRKVSKKEDNYEGSYLLVGINKNKNSEYSNITSPLVTFNKVNTSGISGKGNVVNIEENHIKHDQDVINGDYSDYLVNIEIFEDGYSLKIDENKYLTGVEDRNSIITSESPVKNKIDFDNETSNVSISINYSSGVVRHLRYNDDCKTIRYYGKTNNSISPVLLYKLIEL